MDLFDDFYEINLESWDQAYTLYDHCLYDHSAEWCMIHGQRIDACRAQGHKQQSFEAELPVSIWDKGTTGGKVAEKTCVHLWKEYSGLKEHFWYCQKCDKKKEFET